MSNNGKELRINISSFDGINSTVQPNLAKQTELSHAENVRAPIIGALETRGGQQKVGTKTDGTVFTTSANYGLAAFRNDDGSQQGVVRISETSTISTATQSSSVLSHGTGAGFLYVSIQETLYVTDPAFGRSSEVGIVRLSNATGSAKLYTLGTDNTWSPPAATPTSMLSIIGGQFSFAKTDEGLLMVNGNNANMLFKNDGVNFITASSTDSLYNSPTAKKAAYYKGNMYLANFVRNGVRYKTTVIRSSDAMGLISLVSGDQLAHVSGTALNLTTTKYMYSDTGMNGYDVYRGGVYITSFTVTAINGSSVTITHSGTPDLKTVDEIWITGTYTGAKQYRWVANPTTTGASQQQYDTFKLAGGDNDEITLLEPIGNILMIGNRKNLMTWNNYTLENFDQGVGCVSPTGYTKLLGTLYFTGYDGIFASTGAAPTLVSRKVSRIFAGATRDGLEHAAMGHKGFSVFAAIGDSVLYKQDGSYEKTLHDVVVEYNVTEQNLYIHTNVPASQMESFIDSLGTERLLIAHTGTGCSVKGFLETYADDGEEIFWRIDTSELYFPTQSSGWYALENFAKPVCVIANCPRGTLAKAFVSPDGEDFFELKGTLMKGVSQIFVNAPEEQGIEPIECRKLVVSVRGSTKQPTRI